MKPVNYKESIQKEVWLPDQTVFKCIIVDNNMRCNMETLAEDAKWMHG